MKPTYILCFLLFIVSCRQTEIDPKPIEIPFQTTCLLSKTQHFEQTRNGNLALYYEETYQYDSLKRTAEYAFSYKGGSDTLRYEYSFKDVYHYNSSGFLIEITTNGIFYNGNAKYYGNKPSPLATIKGNTTFIYQNGLLVKEEKYQKVDAEFVVEFINPRTDRKFYEYDLQGKLTKYRNENADDINGFTYFLSNDKIIKSETDWQESSTPKLILNDTFTQWGLLTQHNFPKIYYKDGRYQNRTAENGDYDKYFYDTYGRNIKIEKYRQEYSYGSNFGSTTISDNAVLMNIKEIQYEDTRLPLTTLPLPKGHPKTPDFQGNKTYNIRSNLIKLAFKNTLNKQSDATYNYDYNTEKLPTNLTITNNSYDDKGNILSTNKVGYSYEYVGCK